jgi:hypothetical protein
MFSGEGYSVEIIHGTLDVAEDDSFVVAITTLEIVDGNESEYVDSLRGTWTLDEMNAMQFNVADVEPWSFAGSWQSRHITYLVMDGNTAYSYVFQRTR